MTNSRFDLRVARLERAAAAAAVAAIVVAASVLVGWAAHLPGVRRLHPALGTMTSHAAFGLLLTGAALLLRKRDGRSLTGGSRALALCLLAFSGATVLRSTLGWTFPWDDWMAHTTIARLFPGPMPIATALSFVAFSLGLLFYDTRIRGVWVAEICAGIAGLIGLLGLIAYAYGTVSLFPIQSRRSLAFHTVFLIDALAAAFLFARPKRGLTALAIGEGGSGLMVRRLLPAAIFVPTTLGWLVMEGYRAQWYPPSLAAAYFCLANIVVFSALIWTTAATLQRVEIERARAEETVRTLNRDLEARVENRTAALQDANRELETFSYSVSHDLRAPLRAIDGFSRILLDDYARNLDPQAQDYLRRVCAGSQRMGQLVDDLLSLSKVGRQTVERREIDLSGLAENVAAELRRSEPDRKVTLTVQPSLRANGDRSLLRIVLANLIGNAWKFTRHVEEATIEVAAVSDAPNTYVVRDNGAGFDMRFAAKLFAPFERLHAANEFEGTGIGLATVHRIIQRHGGRIWAEGAPGRGAAFYFTLGTAR